ncbi:MAG TPA: formate dehydrogenase accessory sulfurtransferase FdhD [Thermoanaerobaculia bacterium]|nr:formate dehydrogenase accessory sulfurtransferase FdhD [Thermoanaerobaculia bacterium]
MQTRIRRVGLDTTSETDDVLSVEEPLEIRIGEKPVSVTLRTPGDDFDLVAGFLFTESILHAGTDVAAIGHWGSPNVVRVDLAEGMKVDLQRLQRHFYSTSSCGVCGRCRSRPAGADDAGRVGRSVAREVVVRLPEELRARQTEFDPTGTIHAAGVFEASGELLRVREDVGRHNPVDKVLGSFFREGDAGPARSLCQRADEFRDRCRRLS